MKVNGTVVYSVYLETSAPCGWCDNCSTSSNSSSSSCAKKNRW